MALLLELMLILGGNWDGDAEQGPPPRSGVPSADGYVMPPEWALHQRCFMAWPCHEGTFGIATSERRQAAYSAFAEIARAIAIFEPVTMLANPAQVAEASQICGPGISVTPMVLTDSWTRDIGPTFIINNHGNLAGVDWQFNAWGRNYSDFSADAVMARRLLSSLKIPRYAAPFVMEGGAIHVDGEGTCLATSSVLLNSNRNPNLSRQAMEKYLRDYIGVEKVVWLPGSLEDDETDGHVDNVACFLAPGVVAVLDTDDETDGNYEALKANIDYLEKTKDAKGRAFDIIRLLQPPCRIGQNGRRLALSYINFYFANGGIILPSFDDATDAAAYQKLQRACPDRQIVQVPAQAIVEGGGGIHCITQQMPRGIDNLLKELS
ncbi:MAG: agmatine deiminase family protein [Alphaproteobacteria bacterium]